MANFVKKDLKPKKIDGSFVFADFSYGLYALNTPRAITEQLASLALVGGRNIWSERGALITQHGYEIRGELDENDVIALVTREANATDTFFVVTTTGKVYIYIDGQGLKRYKTDLGAVYSPVACRRGNDLIISTGGFHYVFGAYYNEATAVTIDDDISIDDFDTYYEFNVPYSSKDYYWNGKSITLNAANPCTVVNVAINDELETCRIRAVAIGTHVTYTGSVSVDEKVLKPIDLIYTPEDEEDSPITILPKLMAIANNRLFVVDVQNRIFYSAVGVVDNFNQTSDAGYFQGFFQDNSQVLSIEDYMSGVLICKQNGIYYLTLSANNLTQAAGTEYLTISSNQVRIIRVSQIGQQYATDHVIVRNIVYAYDSNSGSIVIAAQPNYYNNSIVAGSVIVSNEFLNAQDMGIDTSKRFFTFNSEFELITLYYGERLNRGILLTSQGSLFPRELDKTVVAYVGFNQGVMGVTEDGKIFQEFKKGTVIPNITPIAEFEPIGLRDNRIICSSILEVTELNGVRYSLTAANAGYSFQEIIPYSELQQDGVLLPNMMYSDKENDVIYESFELTSKWANKTSNVTRVYAPMSGREGINLTLEFPENTQFCLAALRLPDFSQGE